MFDDAERGEKAHALNITKLDPTPEHPYTRYFLDVRVRVGGKPKRKRETLRGSYGQAKARYFELQAMLRAGGTFGEILDRYAQNRGSLPPSQRTLFENLKRDLGGVSLRDLEKALARYSVLLRSTVSRRGARFSAATINRHRGMAAAALNLAVATRILDRSPLHAGNWPKLKENADANAIPSAEDIRCSADGSDVYFVFSKTPPSVKIGKCSSGSIRNRLRYLQTGNPVDLILLGYISGGGHLEKRLHKQFAHLHIRGEWFQPAEDLMQFISVEASGALDAKHPDPVPGDGSR